jgi:hypothetical protein
VTAQASTESSSASAAGPQSAPGDQRTKVLYIGGTGRTGSTLLTQMLGQYEQFFAAGELAFLWQFGFLDEGKCGCGLLLRDCPTWKSIFDDAYGGAANVDAAELLRLRARFNSKHLPLMVTQGIRDRLLSRAETFPATVERLYHGIASATGSRIVVDSSKEPHYSYILRSLPSLDVYFLHLVRDPRAVAYSWRDRRKKEAGLTKDAMMESRGAALSATYFDVSNIAAELIWARSPDRYKFLRYEDFLADPKEGLRQIGQFVGEVIDPDQIIKDGRLTLGPSHTAWGNPNRFEQGSVALNPEESWRSGMSRERQLAVAAFTLPLMLHYHYPLLPVAATPASPPATRP